MELTLNEKLVKQRTQTLQISSVSYRDVTDSESASESDGIRHFFRNPKSDGYFKSDRNGSEIANY